MWVPITHVARTRIHAFRNIVKFKLNSCCLVAATNSLGIKGVGNVTPACLPAETALTCHGLDSTIRPRQLLAASAWRRIVSSPWRPWEYWNTAHTKCSFYCCCIYIVDAVNNSGRFECRETTLEFSPLIFISSFLNLKVCLTFNHHVEFLILFPFWLIPILYFSFKNV